MSEVWVIEPLVGLNQVHFGMDFEQVVHVLGNPAQKRANGPTTIGYWPQGVSVHFSPGAEFIEVARGLAISPSLHGVDVFTTKADEVVLGLVAAGHAFDPNTEKGHTFVFRNLQIGLWRASVPEEPDDEVGRHFDSVGVGRPNYYR